MKSLHSGIWLVMLALAGCTALQPVKYDPPRTYALEAEFPSWDAKGEGPVLAVNVPRATPGFETARMAFVRKPYELEYFARNQWVDTPARMVAPLLVKAVEAGGGFRAVVTGQSAVLADLRLDTEIVRLQQEFLTNPSRVRLTLRAQLIDQAGRRVLATREFESVEAAPSEDPYGGVTAANRLLKRVLIEVAAFCASQAKAAKP